MSDFARDLFARLISAIAVHADPLTDAELDALCAYAVRCDAATQREYLTQASRPRPSRP